jgi:hypothetical protein
MGGQAVWLIRHGGQSLPGLIVMTNEVIHAQM